ncbi:MAG: hypothetical protein BBJ57_12295 [Desulfobacterales bacterium PC51MH44]|nr:MAG: hypothetical protein BBJ57_12295 [Desulfobacterales bacterium PC51MH44]
MQSNKGRPTIWFALFFDKYLKYVNIIAILKITFRFKGSIKSLKFQTQTWAKRNIFLTIFLEKAQDEIY